MKLNPRKFATGPAPMLAAALFVALSGGCGRFVFQPSPANAAKMTPQQQQVLAQQTQQWQQRAGQLDKDNQDLEARLAQSIQQINLLKEEVVATRDQLRSTTTKLKTALANNQDLKTRTDALTVSVQKRTGASIRPNNSLLKDLAVGHLQGVHVRQDGDVVRVELSADALFARGSAALSPQAGNLVRTAAADLARHYPGHVIGVEGHTESTPRQSLQAGNAVRLSLAQATAVYDALLRSSGISAEQLFVVGHGTGHPVVSNATVQGQQRNRRVELVIYPDTDSR